MRTLHYAGWTPERIERAKRLYMVEGKSASEVAEALGGGVTRNGVIGKIHRMGWVKDYRQQPTNAGRLRAVLTKSSTPKPPKPGPQNRPGAVFGKVSVANAEETERKRTAQAREGQAIADRLSAAANDDAIPLLRRGTFQCSFPVGLPARPAEQLCCGQPVPTDAKRAVPTYCAHHASIALSKHQPARKIPSEPMKRRAA